MIGADAIGGGVIDAAEPGGAPVLRLEGVTESGVFWRLGEWRIGDDTETRDAQADDSEADDTEADAPGVDAPGADAPGRRAARLAELERRRRVGRRWVRDLATSHLGLEWQGFTADAPGRKPRLLGGSGADASISHSGGTLLVGVTADGLVGVDVEEEPFEAFDHAALLRRMCTAEELWALDGLPGELRGRALARAWTVKEATLKAHGWGLARDPREVAVDLEELLALGREHGPERAIVHVTGGRTLVRHP